MQRNTPSLQRWARGAGVLLSICLTFVSLQALAAQPGDAGLFHTWVGYSIGRTPVAVTTADFNGDGAPDVAWARHDFFHGEIPGNTMTVQLNLGEGTLGAPTDWPVVDMSNDIGSADLDGDGDADIVVIGEDTTLTNTTINIYLSNGDGTFTASTAAGGEAPLRLALADFDGDGDIDLAMTDGSASSGVVSVLLNNGDATFGPERRISVGNATIGIAAADLDGDGDVDLAVGGLDSTFFTSEITLLANDGAGTFTVAGSVQPSPTEYIGAPLVVAGDLDGDGDADLVAAGGNSASHVVLLNQGALTFTPVSYAGGFGSVNLALADHDGDGDLDLYSATQGSSLAGDVSYFANQGDGTFAAVAIIESSHQPQDVAVADFNRDGRADIAVPNRGTGTGAIHPQGVAAAFENPPTYPTFNAPDSVVTADFDGDGDIDVASSVPASKVIDVKFNDGTGALTSVATIPATPGQGQPSSVWAADLNGDGLPDLLWTASSFPPAFGVALNQGAGSFSAPVFTAPAGCLLDRVTTADVDNDGDQDVIAGNGQGECPGVASSVLSISLNDGAGTFAAGTFVDMTIYLPLMGRGADVNGDGLTDLVGITTVPLAIGDVAVALGTGNGAFAPATAYVTGTSHREFEVADFDNDGDVDVATSNLGFEDSTSVLLNDGSGNLGAPTTYTGESLPGLVNQWALDTGDVNGDGNVDIVVANRTGRDIGVYFGHGDGTFDVEQVRYGMHAELTDVELADMNGDGGLDAVGPTGTSATAAPAATVATVTRVATTAVAAAASSAPGVSVLLNGSTPGGAFTLSVGKTGSGHGQVTSSPAGIACGATCSYSFAAGTLVTLTATPASDSTFTGWSGACTGTATTCEVPMTAAKSVTATFTASTYTLTVTKSGSGNGQVTSTPPGIACGTTCSHSYAEGTLVTLTATPASDSTFTGWSGACTGTAATCEVPMTAVKSVTATFTASTYTLTVTKTGGGSGQVTSTPPGINCGTTCSHSYAAGTLVTLTATPAKNSTFTGWSGACTGTAARCKVPMTAAKSVTATFTASTYTLTVTKTGSGNGQVTSTPPGINCGTSCSHSYAAGTLVTLTATPAKNSTFTGWSGACTGTAARCKVPMTAAKSVTARFTKKRD